MSKNREAAASRRLPARALAAVGLSLTLFAGVATASDEAGAMEMSNGSIIGSTCMGCHGFQGKGSGDIPRLAGLPKEVIAGKMLDYKADGQEGTVMNRIAKGYSDEEIQAVSEFFANQ